MVVADDESVGDDGGSYDGDDDGDGDLMSRIVEVEAYLQRKVEVEYRHVTAADWCMVEVVWICRQVEALQQMMKLLNIHHHHHLLLYTQATRSLLFGSPAALLRVQWEQHLPLLHFQ